MIMSPALRRLAALKEELEKKVLLAQPVSPAELAALEAQIITVVAEVADEMLPGGRAGLTRHWH